MPQSADKHDGHEVHVSSQCAFAISAQRHVDVVAQEARQRHVPAAPEVDDVRGPVRRIEICGKLDAEHAGQPDRHLGIAGEIEIDLERVGEHAGPRDEEVDIFAGFRAGKDRTRK